MDLVAATQKSRTWLAPRGYSMISGYVRSLVISVGERLVVWSNGPATVAKELKATNCSFAFLK